VRKKRLPSISDERRIVFNQLPADVPVPEWSILRTNRRINDLHRFHPALFFSFPGYPTINKFRLSTSNTDKPNNCVCALVSRGS